MGRRRAPDGQLLAYLEARACVRAGGGQQRCHGTCRPGQDAERAMARKYLEDWLKSRRE